LQELGLVPRGQFQRHRQSHPPPQHLQQPCPSFPSNSPAMTAPSVQTSVTADGTASSIASSAALGAKVASLRTALRRHEEESRRDIRQLNTELVERQEALASTKMEHFHGGHGLMGNLAKISTEVSEAEDAIRAQRTLLEERDTFAEVTEAKLEARPIELSRRLEALDKSSLTLPWASPCRLPGLVARALGSPRSVSFSRGVSPSTALKAIYADLQSCQGEEILQAQNRCEASATELLSEETACHGRLERHEEAIALATQREAAELGLKRRQLWVVHQAGLDEELFGRRAVLDNIRAETSEAEQAYQRLRQALLVEHAEAEKLHAELMEEQALQRRRLIDATSHASGRGLPRSAQSHVASVLASPGADEANTVSLHGGIARRAPVVSMGAAVRGGCGFRSSSGGSAERLADAPRSPRQQRHPPRTAQAMNASTPRLTDRLRIGSTGC
jgi:hypothetical protein